MLAQGVGIGHMQIKRLATIIRMVIHALLGTTVPMGLPLTSLAQGVGIGHIQIKIVATMDIHALLGTTVPTEHPPTSIAPLVIIVLT